MSKERILSFAMSEKLSEQMLDSVTGGRGPEITHLATYDSKSGYDVSIDL